MNQTAEGRTAAREREGRGGEEGDRDMFVLLCCVAAFRFESHRLSISCTLVGRVLLCVCSQLSEVNFSFDCCLLLGLHYSLHVSLTFPMRGVFADFAKLANFGSSNWPKLLC